MQNIQAVTLRILILWGALCSIYPVLASELTGTCTTITQANERADTLVQVGFYDYPPMMMEKRSGGIYHDIFEELGRLSGLCFRTVYYPYARSSDMFNKGEIDIDPGNSPLWTKEHPVPGLYTISFARSVDVILFGPGKRFHVNHPRDMVGKTLGTVRGYFYPGFTEYFANKSVSRFDRENESQLLKLLALSRLDQIIINKNIALYRIQQQTSERPLELGDEVGSVDIMMRVHPNKAHLVPKLNAAISILRKSGQIERIYQTYQ